MSHYRVIKLLGEGGMGMVFEAEDLNLERHVALKVMKPHLAAKPVQKERFVREAKAMAALRNDHVVTIYQVGEEKGLPFLAMERLQGMPMDAWLAMGRKPTIQQVLRLGRQAALGLAAAHEKGLIHRDITPANLWIESSGGGRIKILDFGLARSAENNVPLTQLGLIVGTPAYMAPEQARGLRIDARADLFSLGCVLYRLLTGQTPFQGATTMAILTSLAMDSPRPIQEWIPDVPIPLAELVHKLLAKNPHERPASAKAVAQALGAIERELAASQPLMAQPLEGTSPAPTSPPSPPQLVRAPKKRGRRWLLWTGLAFGLILALGALHWLLHPRGTLEIEMDDAAIELSIHMGDETIVQGSRQRSFELPAGKGKLEVFEPGQDPLFAVDFEITRNERTVLRLQDELVKKRAAKVIPEAKKPVVKTTSPLEQLRREEIAKDFFRPAGHILGKKPAEELVAVWRVPGSVPGLIPLVNNVLFSRDGTWMITSGMRTPALLWDLRNKAKYTSLSEARDVAGVWLADDDRTLFVAFPNLLQVRPFPDGLPSWEVGTKTGEFLWQVSPDGRWIAAWNAFGSIQVFDVRDQKEQNHYKGLLPRSLTIHPTKPRLLVLSGREGQPDHLRFMDLEEGRIEGTSKREVRIDTTSGASTPTFSPDGANVYLASPRNPFVYRYQVHDGNLTTLGPFGRGLRISISPDGKHLAASSAEGKVQIMNVDKREVTRELSLPYLTDRTSHPFFAPDGRHLAVACQDLVFLFRLE